MKEGKEQAKVQKRTKATPISQKQKDIDYYNAQIATVENKYSLLIVKMISITLLYC